MSGVWVFKNGVLRLIENPANEQSSTIRRKVLLHIPTNEVITSYEALERKLMSLGWERYYDDLDLLQFHKRSSVDLISLPKEFNRFKSMHMYDIVVKNRETFKVIDMAQLGPDQAMAKARGAWGVRKHPLALGILQGGVQKHPLAPEMKEALPFECMGV
ncbi:hypothetical protein ZIOFF_039789 [Zingiber officinale]|uniref:Flowering-promoting factor 1-like protein 1 n=2 Tax=Zingiber officinale TaxID=94328 RepID=A0A8J5L430_ZINOF|nr:hypothetical protein ZIOFF_039789 [Zingiber officinale]